VHHRHADANFAVIDTFWDRVLGTYRSPDPETRDDRAIRGKGERLRPPFPPLWGEHHDDRS
jgi:sterol desaturase/sphingolipid hydroxylase (fatty acid hydroxylase superfamily)